MKTLRVYFLLAIILVLLFFFKLAFTDHILARGDTYAYFYPYWHIRDSYLRVGELPLWSSDLFMGVPLLANSQLGTLYPPNWLTIWASPPDAIRISILVHVLWAVIGAMLLARQALRIASLPALIAGVAFGLGGYIGSHVEQINQLHGLSWMPWLFLCLHLAVQKRRYWLLLGLLWALQLLTGHTQTVFITGVGLGIMVLFTPNRYGLAMASPYNSDNPQIDATRNGGLAQSAYIRHQIHAIYRFWTASIPSLLGLLLAAMIAITLALPQLIPTQTLILQSNRGGGLTAQQATAFSLDPTMIGRGLLPSYDGQPFGEYVAYVGIIGLALMVVGIFASEQRKWAWIGLSAIGFLLALGRFNPLYYSLLAELPGFNLFRVPARWLALYALGGAMLIGLGAHTILYTSPTSRRRMMMLGTWALLCVLLIAGAHLADRATEPVVGSAIPTISTWVGWGMALAVGCAIFVGSDTKNRIRWQMVVGGLFIIELFMAGLFLPHQDLTVPDAYHEARFAIHQLQAYNADAIVPDRFLSISTLYFDPGDKSMLQARWERAGMSENARSYAFTTTKLKEVIGANLPLVWGLPTIDGFDGGVLPTAHYTAFTSLLLPDGALRTIDGRLRDNLALASCGGACIPDDRWLDLTNTRYLITDKIYDVVHDGIFYDTQFKRPTDVTWHTPVAFSTDAVHLLYRCLADDCDVPQIRVDDDGTSIIATLHSTPPNLNGDTLAVYPLGAVAIPQTITPMGDDNLIVAITLVDSRTGDFLQIHPQGWQRVYSADIKIYENLDVMPRAFMVYDVHAFPDTWDGTEQALVAMRDSAFDPRTMLVINTNDPLPSVDGGGEGRVIIQSYQPHQVMLHIETTQAGYLVLTDAYYPNWHAQSPLRYETPVYRANVMFRAIYIPEGTHGAIFIYRGW